MPGTLKNLFVYKYRNLEGVQYARKGCSIREKNVRKSKSMKKYLILFLIVFVGFLVHAQNGFGFDLGLGTSKAPMIAVKYYLDKNAFSVGASYQVFNDALGKNKDLQSGDSAIGDGDYFYSFDIGYTRILSEKFSIAGEISFGQRKYFQNIRDDSAPSGGYHRILDSKSVVGGGGLLFYNISEAFSLFAGYNSLREGTFGLEFRIVRQQQY
jgi:hypothetical protein